MQSEIKPMYSLQSISLLLRYALNYGMGCNQFSVECNASAGFKIKFLNEAMDYYEAINTTDKVLINTKPVIDLTKGILKFSEVNNNIYSFKPTFDDWIRTLYMIQKRKLIKG